MEKKMIPKVKICLLYLAFFVICCYVLTKKVDYDMDELLTYNLSNAESWFSPEDGRIYNPADQPFVDAMASNGTFDLKHVWDQQTNDTHPPLYYVLVHSICVLFPGSVSIGYAGVINIIFIILTLFIYRKTLKILVDNDKIEFILSLTFCLSAGVLSIVAFLRMYVMAMFFVTTFSYVIVSNIEHLEKKQYLLLVIITVSGTLTHYYFIVYAFFTSLIFCVIMLFQRRFREFFIFAASMGLAGGMTYAIFPAIISHLFERGRGAESIENLKTTNIVDQIINYTEIVDSSLFGGALCLILILLMILLLFDLIFIGRQEGYLVCHFDKIQAFRYICILFPALCYVILVAKSAPYNIDRYVSPIFAIVIAGTWGVLYSSFKNVFSNAKIRIIIYSTLVTIVTVINLMNNSWGYLNLDRKESLNNASLYGAGSRAIVLYDEDWKINPYFREISCCDTSVFYNLDGYRQFCEKTNAKELPNAITLFLIGIDEEKFIHEFLESHSEYKMVLDNGEWAYGHSYYLKK